MSKILTLLVTASAFGAGCKSTDDSDAKGIFGQDDRALTKIEGSAWGPVGLLSSACTGTLVGPRTVLTAAHCTKANSFTINYDAKTKGYADRATVTGIIARGMDVDTSTAAGLAEWSANRGKDWALLRLDKALGDTYGTFSIAPTTAAVSGLTLVGYPGDWYQGGYRRVKSQVLCGSKGFMAQGKVFYHHCDAWGGQSGAPLIKPTADGSWTTIVGIHISGPRKKMADSSTEHNQANALTDMIPHLGLIE